MKIKRKLRQTITGFCVALILAAALTGVAADAAGTSSQTAVREVGSNLVYLYANPELSGSPRNSYTRGQRITVALNDSGSCTVYDASGNSLGYCSPVDLVVPGTTLFVQVPYQYTTDLYGRTKVFDLIDLDLYLSETASNVYKNVSGSGEEKILLVSRVLLSDLESAAAELARSGIGLWVDEGYRPDDNAPGSGMAAYNTGCILDLVLIRDNSEMNAAPNSSAFRQALNILQKHGFYLADGSSYTFGYDDFDACYGVNLDLSDLPRIALD